MTDSSRDDSRSGTLPLAVSGGRDPTVTELWNQLHPALLEAQAIHGPWDVHGVLQEYVAEREPRARTRAWAILGPALDDLAEQYGRSTIEPFLERVAERVQAGWE